MHPNANAPSDGSLVDSGRTARFDKAAYTDWLKRLRAICTERGIVLIFDEVFVGFRLARGGAQEYFGVKADMVTYGKTLGGGLPIGVVCGRKDLMRRFRDDRPVDVCFARGTFNAHPYVMAAMHEFLERLDSDDIRALYVGLDALWDGRAERLNRRLRDDGPAGAGREPVVDLDGQLHHAVALQLDVPVLSARRGPGAELDRHRPADLQPELHRCGFRRGRRPLRRRRQGDAAGRLVVGRSGDDQQVDQAQHPA